MKSQYLWRLVTAGILIAMLVASVGSISNASAATSRPQMPNAMDGPFSSPPVEPTLSPSVRSLRPSADSGISTGGRMRINPLQNEPDQGARGTWDRAGVPIDPLSGSLFRSPARTPATILSFDGGSNPSACGGCSPPDTNGDVGPNHYVQMVNVTKVSIFNKSGVPLVPQFDLGSLWSSGACTGNAGDPVVVYDDLANRWVLSQFQFPSQLCFAVSQTPDPTGAYFLYEFNVSSFPDYFKVGVWPDGYYVSANEATYTAYAFDRANMLAGNAATFVKFTGQTNFLLPSDLDGSTTPPANSPNLFYTFKDNSFHGGVDRLEVFAFQADFVTPANSTFTLQNTFNIASFTYTVCGFFNLSCVQQSGTATKVDVVSEWPMHRFAYRNFAGYQALAGNFTVGGGTGQSGAAIRWFELRNTGAGWTLYQEGTVDPGDGNDRFIGSIAIDKSGNLALGYSVSSSTMFPSIRYTVHETTDALGTMQAEATMTAGGGSQTGSNRWGDYSAMSIDPSDGCTFWYTNEYYSASSSTGWKTRIASFKIPTCGALPDLVITKTNNVSGSVVYPGGWKWTITITNTGNANAVFNFGETFFQDNFPSTNVNYTYAGYTSGGGFSVGGVGAAPSGTSDVWADVSGGTATIPPGAWLSVSYNATPTAPGTFANPRSGGSCTVDPNGDVAESNESNNTCSDSVTVTAPEVGLSTTSLSFGNVLVGTPSTPQTVTVTNSGDADLHIGLLSINSDFGLSNDTCSNATVTPTNSCTFDVIFQPLSIGYKSGSVSIPSDAGSSPDTVSLDGTGVVVPDGTNLLKKPDFASATIFPNPWQLFGVKRPYASALDCAVFQVAPCSVFFPSGSRSAMQRVLRNGLAGDMYQFGLSSMAQNGGGKYLVEVTFYNNYNRPVGTTSLNFTPGTHGWETVSGFATATGNYNRIVFRFYFQNPVGRAWFDDAFLIVAP